ncbi:MAG: archease [Candidatus Diapherotrites archaeon]
MHELFEHTADVGIRGKGKTMKEAFSECGNAMLSVMYELKKVNPKEKVYITIKADSLENLLINYLNEVLAQKDLKEMAFQRILVKRIEEKNKTRTKIIKEKQKEFFLKAECFGEKLDLVKHSPKTEVKAATYSGLKIEKKENEFMVQCIADV